MIENYEPIINPLKTINFSNVFLNITGLQTKCGQNPHSLHNKEMVYLNFHILFYLYILLDHKLWSTLQHILHVFPRIVLPISL